MSPKVNLWFILFLVSFNCKLTDSDGVGTEWMYFPDGDGVPRYINLLQSAPNVPLRIKRDVEFRFYPNSRDNFENYIVLNDLIMNGQLDIKELIHEAPLKVITHGWMSSADKGAVMDLVDAYSQARRKVNIIAVDWSSFTINYNYVSVAQETKEVGKAIAEFLDYLNYYLNVSGDQIHLIGHSLGAHVMGIAGFESIVQIGRITGLDPALPLFKTIQEDKNRLDYGDAIFVDVIHTCGGVLGFWDAIGKADFYPNNGWAPQPGCKGNIFQFEACSHGRAISYYSESIINPKAFPSYQCADWKPNMKRNCSLVGFMGESASWNMSGIFYLQTNSEEPFGRGLDTSK